MSDATKKGNEVNWHHINAYLLASGLALFATVGTAQEITGSVETVDQDGQITLMGGKAMQLWGLRITQFDKVERLLQGRDIDCLIVHEEDPIPAVDCTVFSVITLEKSPEDGLNLFSWLPEFDWAEKECPKYDNVPYSRHKEGYISYACREDRGPSRGRPIQ